MKVNAVPYKTYLKHLVLVILLSITACLQFAKAQVAYKSTASSIIKVDGTSNVHDWTMKAANIESQVSFKFNTRNELVDVTALNLSVLAKNLKSGKSTMDSRTYKSMKADQFPKVLYQLKSATVNPLQNNRYSIATTGNLTIAGVTQSISMTVTATINADNTISCHGKQALKLTDYKIDPPSFMMGAMKVGNELDIQFDMTFSK